MPDPRDGDEDDVRRWPQLAVIVIVILLLTLALLRWNSQRDESGGNTGSEAPASASASSDPRGQADQVPDREVAVDDSAMIGQMMQDLGRFVPAFYQIEPGDTSETRRARFDQADLPVAPGLRDELDFSISGDADLELVPFDGRQSLDASLNGEYQVTDIYGDGSLYNIITSADAVQSDETGSPIGQLYVMIGTTWSQEGDGYVLTNYTDTYQQSGG